MCWVNGGGIEEMAEATSNPTCNVGELRQIQAQQLTGSGFSVRI